MNMSDQPLHKMLVAFANDCHAERTDEENPCHEVCDNCNLLIEWEADIRLRFAELVRKYIAEDCVTL
jgi:hypothetical protein